MARRARGRRSCRRSCFGLGSFLDWSFACQPLLAVVLILGLLIAFGALILRLQDMLFGEPNGPRGTAKASYVPLFLHLAIVLAAGHASRGVRAVRMARSFFGPQCGCARRSASTASRISAAIARPCACGARERSANPCAGSASYRFTHL